MQVTYSDKMNDINKFAACGNGLYVIGLPASITGKRLFKMSKGLSLETCELLARQRYHIALQYTPDDGRRLAPVADFVADNVGADVIRLSDDPYRLWDVCPSLGSISFAAFTNAGGIINPANSRLRGYDTFDTSNGQFSTLHPVCRDCGATLETEAERERGTCDECWRNRAARIYSYHRRPHKTTPLFTAPNGRSKWLHIGVEDEVDGKGGDLLRTEFARTVSAAFNSNADAPVIEFENDCSTNEGVECITAPLTFSAHKKLAAAYNTLYSAATEYGGGFHKVNGLHFHLDRAFFGDDWSAQIYLECMVYKYMSIWKHISGRTDEANTFNYARRKSAVKSLLTAAANTDDQDHYYALNGYGRDTIELRWFGGTIDTADRFFAALDIAQALAEWAKKAVAAEGRRDNFAPASIVPYIRDASNVLAYIDLLPAQAAKFSAGLPEIAENEQPAYDAFYKALKNKANASKKTSKEEY